MKYFKTQNELLLGIYRVLQKYPKPVFKKVNAVTMTYTFFATLRHKVPHFL